MGMAPGVQRNVDAATLADRDVVATYPTYQQAQRAVDHLSDSGFPVEQVSIVGRDLRLIEQVTGRLTTARAAMLGAASGAWWGLFIGLLIGLFTVGPVWLNLIVAAVVIGALWGAVFGFIAQWATRGQRDFASATALAAGQYDVAVTKAQADRARELLSRLA